MARLDDAQRSAARAKAEALLTQKKRQESERVAKRERDDRLQDEKIARLRALRLAKEAEEKSLPKPAMPSGRKPAAKPAG